MKPKNHQWAVGDLLELRYANISYGSEIFVPQKKARIGGKYRVKQVRYNIDGVQVCTVEFVGGHDKDAVGDTCSWYAWRFELASNISVGDYIVIRGLVHGKDPAIPDEMVDDINNKLCIVKWVDGESIFVTGHGFDEFDRSWTINLEKNAPDSIKVNKCKPFELNEGDRVFIGALPNIDNAAHRARKKYEHSEAKVDVVAATGLIMLDNSNLFWEPEWLFKLPDISKEEEKLFNVGDHVVIENKGNGFPKWVKDQDACLYEIGKIKKVDAERELYFIVSFSGEWWYSHQSVMKEAAFVKKGGEIKKPNNSVLSICISDWLKQAREKANHVANYALFLRNKKTGLLKVLSHLGDVCHARLGKTNNYGIPFDNYDLEAVVDFPFHKESKGLIEEFSKMSTYKIYVDYIVNRSPWAIAFKGKTAKSVIENGVEINLDATSGQVVGACTALRMGAEYAQKLPAFQWALDQGATENQAFMMGWFFNLNNGEFKVGVLGGGHNALCETMSAQVVWDFFNKGFPDLKEGPYKTDVTKYRVFRAVGDDVYYENRQQTKNCLRDFLYSTAFPDRDGKFGGKNILNEEQAINFLKALSKHIKN